MAQTTLNIRIDEEIKKGLEEFCSNVGMNISVAVNMFAKAVIREQRLPFEVTTITKNIATEYQSANLNVLSSMAERFIDKHDKAFEELSK